MIMSPVGNLIARLNEGEGGGAARNKTIDYKHFMDISQRWGIKFLSCKDRSLIWRSHKSYRSLKWRCSNAHVLTLRSF